MNESADLTSRRWRLIRRLPGYAITACLLIFSTGCADNSPPGAATDITVSVVDPPDGGADAGPTDDTVPGTDTGGPSVPPVPCDQGCDDGNPCTEDTCEDDVCVWTPRTAAECRPQLTLLTPGRGATFEGTSLDDTVVVIGTATSAAAPITGVWVNGDAVQFDEEGGFEAEIGVAVGGNTLVVSTEDALGQTRRQVQSFNWSTRIDAGAEPAPQGMALWLSTMALDDTDHDESVVDDLGTVFQDIVALIDVASALPSPAFEGLSPLPGTSYDVYIESFEYPEPALTLTPENGGFRIDMVISGATGDIRADRQTGLLVPAQIDGTLDIETTTISAVVAVDLEDHLVAVTLAESDVNIDGLQVNLEGTVPELLEPLILAGIGDLTEDAEAVLRSRLDEIVIPLTDDVFERLALDDALAVEALGEASEPVELNLTADYHSVTFDGVGGTMRFRTRLETAPESTPAQMPSAGVVRRDGCGLGAATLSTPQEGDGIELALHDDLLNQLSWSLWTGGLFAFEVPAEIFEGIDLSSLGITDVQATLDIGLPPTMTDCGSGELRLHIGELRADAVLTIAGQAVPLTLHASFDTPVSVGVADGMLGLSLGDIVNPELEVTIHNDPFVVLEPAIEALVVDKVLPGLLASLEGGSLGGIPLPTVDLTGVGGLPPTVLAITPDATVRMSGHTLVRGTIGEAPEE